MDVWSAIFPSPSTKMIQNSRLHCANYNSYGAALDQNLYQQKHSIVCLFACLPFSCSSEGNSKPSKFPGHRAMFILCISAARRFPRLCLCTAIHYKTFSLLVQTRQLNKWGPHWRERPKSCYKAYTAYTSHWPLHGGNSTGMEVQFLPGSTQGLSPAKYTSLRYPRPNYLLGF